MILGCGHAGVINTLWHVRTLTDGRPIRSVVGGMHLRSAREERLLRTIVELRQLGSPRLYPGHCTGFTASARLWHEFPDRCSPCAVGTIIDLDGERDFARMERHAAPGRHPVNPPQPGTRAR